MKTLDLNSWNRKEHFNFFSQFDEPFFGIVSEIDCTIAYRTSKEKGHSFFAYYLHKSLLAVNGIEEFKYRIDEDKVIVYDKIHASPTIGRDDGTFAFSFIEFNDDFLTFEDSLKKEIENVQDSVGLRLTENASRKDAIHYSSIPWNTFTGLTHARNFKFVDSVPKITFGKIFLREEKKIMPVSINAHHGLVDGLHVGKHLTLFQKLMDE
ncbi:MAG: chloramphenicol acetyltransferase [Ignavibacteriaceae bacterium]|jgi:chloramphenicol O-acetyltransferase type A|nr:chloramphenicol acetyltransferase [Ignavibacteriaceae bacterium]